MSLPCHLTRFSARNMLTATVGHSLLSQGSVPEGARRRNHLAPSSSQIPEQQRHYTCVAPSQARKVVAVLRSVAHTITNVACVFLRLGAWNGDRRRVTQHDCPQRYSWRAVVMDTGMLLLRLIARNGERDDLRVRISR